MSLRSFALFLIFLSGLFFLSFSFELRQSDSLRESMERGEELYISYCITCHLQNGEGIANTFPPLANSDYLMADVDRSIQQVIEGASGEMKVNGVVYNNVMPAVDMTDKEVADVLNYIRNSWGNKGEMITEEQVAAIR